jgi:transposase
MRDIDLYAQILGLRAPWHVVRVALGRAAGSVTVEVAAAEGATFVCPACGKASPGYDRRRRRWRHLDTCQFTTLLEADAPRVSCAEHGVVTVAVPWATPGSGYTLLFEALVIGWLKEASVKAVSEARGAIDRIIQRAVERCIAFPLRVQSASTPVLVHTA